MHLNHLLEFAKLKYQGKITLPTSFKFFLFECYKTFIVNGENRTIVDKYLIAAPDREHARTWVQYDFLCDNDDDFKSYQDLVNQLTTFNVGENHHFYCSYPNYTEVGENQYRKIRFCHQLAEHEVETIQKYKLYHVTNFEYGTK
ncbi:hypothetical protein HYG89_14535 [Acinetobacter sp. SwsAc5]|uniref:hypothetical protein n=1 Tax=Acinetobacter sp. SwsAc5 TaxID=2749438 RepID=UPI0015BD86CD|nr:hypothetical protein [Acinetobacter sp. SwsAc5]NWK53740.1 hypothetical protein [Acinetobacter sp. SwsAc5]